MATKTFTKSVWFAQPPWVDSIVRLDELYVDGDFFTKNIPIRGASITIAAIPSSHARFRSLQIKIYVYDRQFNMVYDIIVFSHIWLPWVSNKVEQTTDLVSNDGRNLFYGMGLNFCRVLAEVNLVTNVRVEYDLDYALEVNY